MNEPITAQPILRELGDGLVLRRSSPADAQALADFSARLHSDEGPDHPDQNIAAWVTDLLTKPHPTFSPQDFTVVAEAATGRIVSTMNLIPQTWTYEGIPFKVGRPELVATLPEYRNRGLIRLQFEEIHRWSRERGDLVQAITGIPYYYRLFGYEMALDLGGRRIGYPATLPALKEGQSEQVRFRRAERADLPFVAELYAQAQKRYAISCERGEDILLYELEVQSREQINHLELVILEDHTGKPLGYLQHTSTLWEGHFSLGAFEQLPGLSWLEAAPAAARYLWQQGLEAAARKAGELKSIVFRLGRQHPAYEALGPALPTFNDPYGWYLRVEDLPAFIRHIAPALEQRLADSPAAGFSGQLLISFYRPGLRLEFQSGRLVQAANWQPGAREDEADASFPGLTFLQLLFGYKSFDELGQAFPDCYWKTWRDRVILNSLFPKRPSDVLPVA